MSVLALLSLLLLCAAHPRQNFRCLYYKGECVPHCPRNMHPYHTRCDQDALSQRTCSSRYVYPIGVDHCPEHMYPVHSRCQPTYSQQTCDEPRSMPLGIICDWSRCDCDHPFVLHLSSGYCFLLEDCP
ncbi:uncharacterized protein LOC133523777 isoform X1 [Cydia pomonella]|uniref:uncharacterized protein LOC133523777 isoform X1 n=1 Tax=Cydia pomonella TaxID=82600 RepID=UPI002ADE7E36|nr:uncharacterized protein LOC133523777 isoform X1 [Cydia pomonella]